MPQCANPKKEFDYMKNVIYLKGEPLQIEQLIGQPNDIFHIDSLLVYCDRYDGKSISVFDLKNNYFVGRFISEGQGPNEVIPLLHLITYPQKDKLYTYQRDAAIISIFDVPDFNIQNNIKISSSTPWRPFEIQKTKDYYIGMGIFDNGRFGVYDCDGNFLYTGGVYPYEGENLESSKAFLMYQGPLCTNPDNNCFVSASSYCDNISFYEITENSIIILKEYYSYNSTVDVTHRVIIKDNTIINYTWAYGTNSFCYMLFSGETFSSNNKRARGGHYIIVFDWKGNYIKTFNVDYKIFSLCVDETNNCIYACAQEENGDYIIVRLKI